MEIIPSSGDFRKGFRKFSYSLVRGTRSNNSIPSEKDLSDALADQLRHAERKQNNRQTKKIFEKILRAVGRIEEADKISRCCANYKSLVCENGHYNLSIPDYECNLAFCPDCGTDKAKRAMRRDLPKLLAVLRRDRSLIVVSVMLSLKTQKGRDLKAGCEKLKAYFGRLRRRGILADCLGGFMRIENTKTEDGWHPHVHAVMVLRKPIPQTELSKHWQSITGDSTNVHIQKVSDFGESLVKILQYPYKAADLTKLDASEIDQVLSMKGERLGTSFGVMFGMKLEPQSEVKKPVAGDPCKHCLKPVDWCDFTDDEYIRYLSAVPVPTSRGKPMRWTH